MDPVQYERLVRILEEIRDAIRSSGWPQVVMTQYPPKEPPWYTTGTCHPITSCGSEDSAGGTE